MSKYDYCPSFKIKKGKSRKTHTLMKNNNNFQDVAAKLTINPKVLSIFQPANEHCTFGESSANVSPKTTPAKRFFNNTKFHSRKKTTVHQLNTLDYNQGIIDITIKNATIGKRVKNINKIKSERRKINSRTISQNRILDRNNYKIHQMAAKNQNW
mmetsp:Transcript_13389/g.11886  ORF Transcript_13389/g.11886 Transcript_13389/m.11886 type:complete len:155 (-) Transcript_13389:106-570(-)